jgi:ribosomal protein S18 acetylase RimI-like enzyme
MQIRRANHTDLDSIEALWREMMDFHAEFDDYFRTNPDADANHRVYMMGLILDENKRIFVADDGSQLLGYLMAQINEYPPIYKYQRYGHIAAVSVTASARRRGIGSQLLNAALGWFREKSLRRVECTVAVKNPASQTFWKGVGFRGYLETHVLEL